MQALSPTQQPRRLHLVAALIAAALIAACGGGSDDTDTAADPLVGPPAYCIVDGQRVPAEQCK